MPYDAPPGLRTVRAAFADYRSGRLPLDDLWRAACRAIVEDVGSTRASIWTFEDGGRAIVCRSVYDARTGETACGARLAEEDCPDYFTAVRTEAVVVAPDVDAHPATRTFRAPYLADNGIRSLLDVVVMHATAPAAVLCCETVGRGQSWTDRDVRHLRAVADALGFALLARVEGPA
jgi:GAF domain-containing protein